MSPPSPGPPDAAPRRTDGGFRTTRWSLVVSAGRAEAPSASDALEELCRSYWYPLYAYVRRRGHGPDDARDLVQGYFARLIEKRDLAQVDRSRGRFRAFLLGTLKHYLANERERENADKRGGGHALLSLDVEDAEATWRRTTPRRRRPSIAAGRSCSWTA